MKFLTSVVTSAIAITSAVAFAPSAPLLASRSSALYMSDTTTGIAGTVKWYNVERGFGFIAVDDGSPDMYVHATGLTLDGPLMEDDRVSFETELDQRTNKPKAVNVVRISDEAPAPVEEEPAVEEPVVESVVEEVIEAVKEELSDDEKRAKSIAMETFQRARLQAQLEQMAKETPAVVEAEASVDYDATVRLAFEASGAAGDFDAFKTQYLADKSAAVAKKYQDAIAAEKAAVEAAAAEKAAAAEAKAAEEKAAAEAAAAAEAKAAEEKAAAEAAAAAAKAAEEKAAAEAAAAKAKAEAEAAAAAAEAEEAAAKELGFPSAAVMKARLQPKSPEEEAALAAKYGAMELGEKAFTILTDLGMIDLNPDPSDPNRDTSKDDEDME
eukprot:CAMPEP_0196255490 /NCGR_PEP_ID=MMETSP0913-20130531/55348_1 /TAXON_ID=49265 /ORGANISM="Thalassiosira rotula, Strain GSO102" /LENGTH=382 /DNA_ID=CAMNT_0041542957 /DNA_START=28 /DNA_END=1176 /DNA_ORIENTATION=+